MSPFRNILKLSAGDFLAKTLHFAAFIYLARVLGVATYGVLELALSVIRSSQSKATMLFGTPPVLT